MHPLVQSRPRAALYAGAWVLVGLLLALLLSLQWRVDLERRLLLTVPLAVVYGIVCLSAMWVCRALPLERTPAWKLAAGWLAAALWSSAMWVALATAWTTVLVRAGRIAASRDEIVAGAGATFWLGVLLYLTSGVVHYLLLAFEASREAERRALESQVSAREAELRALRAQLNPHFLFNSLNSINALVGSDPEGARRMCENLGDFMRRTLVLGARDAVTLEEELALAERYFAIERVRFGDRLQVQMQVEAGAERCLVPPLLLQPLLENAVKHGIAARVEGGIVRLGAAVAGDMLRLSVESPLDEDAGPQPGEGVGLQNVRRRLDVLSSREARLDTSREGGMFRVTLMLPVRRAPVEPTGAAHA